MWLDDFLRKLRFEKARKFIREGDVLCDIGCGLEAFLLQSSKGRLTKGIGIDKKIPAFRSENLELINSKLEQEIPLSDNSVDCVTMLAVLEHLIYPAAILKECFRILKNGGRLIITAPTPRAKFVLELLAYRLKLLDQTEIREHLNYFSLNQIKDLLAGIGFKIVAARQFEFGFNNFIIAQK